MNAKVTIAYLIVVLIWSTTPLGIVWSSETVHPSMAVLLRMLIAAVIGLLVIFLKRIPFPTSRTAIKLYAYSGLGIFGGMSAAYMAAKYLTSGTMSLIFGLAPLISAVLARKILNEPAFSRLRKIALAVALFGLAIVCSDNLTFSQGSWLGLVYILSAVLFFSLSGVLVKSIEITINPLSTTVGALLLTLPLFILVWLLMDGTLPIEQWSERSIYSILYLGIFGSLIGFVAYYYILQKLDASTVALVTLMTPVIALIIGSVFNQEPITIKLIVGAALVMLGLGLFLYGDRLNRHIARLRI
ncbi:MAG: DMT family transporter [Kangiellaceae bacterium]|nr:DMT family transporter [Kangiellaceae bacterium]